ncbi:MAG: hypothetical protein ACRCYQ_00705 [Nocardioides sp.]
MTKHTAEEAVAREVRDAYRHLRRAEIKGTALRHHDDRPLVRRIRRARWYRLHYRPAAARFDRAVLAYEAHLTQHRPGLTPRDFLDACAAILKAPDDTRDGPRQQVTRTPDPADNSVHPPSGEYPR